MNMHDLERLAAGNQIDFERVRNILVRMREIRKTGFAIRSGYRLRHPFAAARPRLGQEGLRCSNCDALVDR
jgi:hypothetical protein